MNRRHLMLAALSVANGAMHTPVQVQKLFFLIDQEIADEVGGPHFEFEPYNYGPFDQEVYRELDVLAERGFVEMVPQSTWSSYRLTDEGQAAGEKYLAELKNKKAKSYIRQASEFVRSLSFTQLVSAIYKAYPEMRENSVFQH